MKLREAEEKESKDWDRERDQEGDSWHFFSTGCAILPRAVRFENSTAFEHKYYLAVDILIPIIWMRR